MAIVTVTKTDKTQKGKDRVYFDNRHGWVDAFYVGQRCPLPQVGQTIDPLTSSKDFNGDGKLTWFLNDWKPANGVPQTPNQTLPPQTGGAPKTGGDTRKGWAIDYGDLSRFVSNVVGSAIAANRIEKPSDMAPWIASAYRALEAVREGKILDFDDEPPALMELPEGPDPTEEQGQEFEEEIPW